ncbi:MAG: hypothetical protein WBV73_10120 [Phormidium sp.]
MLRGLFRAGNGRMINADVNDSANIVRKAFPNAFAEGIQGLVVRPVRVAPYKRLSQTSEIFVYKIFNYDHSKNFDRSALPRANQI